MSLGRIARSASASAPGMVATRPSRSRLRRAIRSSYSALGSGSGRALGLRLDPLVADFCQSLARRDVAVVKEVAAFGSDPVGILEMRVDAEPDPAALHRRAIGAQGDPGVSGIDDPADAVEIENRMPARTAADDLDPVVRLLLDFRKRAELGIVRKERRVESVVRR